MAANNNQFLKPLWVLSEISSGQTVFLYYYYSNVLPNALSRILSSFFKEQTATEAVPKTVFFSLKKNIR